MLALAVTLLLLGLLAAGIPVGFALAMAGSVGLYLKGGPQMMLAFLETTPFSTTNSYELITVPLFLLMAEFVMRSGIAGSLFTAAAMWTGRLPGGLAVATALAGAGFGAVSGSSVASAATLASTSIPEMLKRNYEPRLAYGVVAISGTLAMLIPPSIALILYGIIADVSIGKLLVAGVLPGLAVTATIALTVFWLVWRDPARAPALPAYPLREKLGALRVAGPMAALILAVTGVIYAGIATPTEASGIGALGAMLLALWERKLDQRGFRQSVVNALRTSCMIVMVILGAHIFGYFLTLTQSTQQLVGFISGLEVSRWLIFTLLIGLFLLLGCFLDTIAILVLTIPVVLPVVKALGFDPIWFGVMVIVTVEVGLVTPPVGLNVFVISRYAKAPLGEVFRGSFPHVVAHLVLIAVLSIFPEIVLWLPSTMGP